MYEWTLQRDKSTFKIKMELHKASRHDEKLQLCDSIVGDLIEVVAYQTKNHPVLSEVPRWSCSRGGIKGENELLVVHSDVLALASP